MQTWIGIDCGKHGAVAAITADGKVYSWHTPAIVHRSKKRKKSAAGKTRYSSKTEYNRQGMLALLQIFREWQASGQELLVTIEQQRQRPADSKQVVFQVGYGQGLWEMACDANKLEFIKVLPSQWKPCYVPLGADKKESINICRKLYPAHELPLAKDEARAEAILIADYTMRKALSLPYPFKRK
jgi:Holliday junction resolvasome RuvABC endonuclease subunit